MIHRPQAHHVDVRPPRFSRILNQRHLHNAWTRYRSEVVRDGVERWQEFEGEWKRWLSTFTARDRATCAYGCWDLSKPGGGTRRIYRFPVEEKILHRAVAEALRPVAEKTLSPGCFAYREKHTTLGAVWHLLDRLETRRYLVRLDIARCFDSISHAQLFASLEKAGVDPELRQAIAWLLQRFPPDPGSGTGLPQGSPLSPMLSNFALSPFDHAIAKAGFPFMRYADDVAIGVSHCSEGEEVFVRAGRCLKQMGLQLNSSKSGVMPVAEAECLGFAFRRSYGGRWAPAVSPWNIELALQRVAEILQDHNAGLASRIIETAWQEWLAHYGKSGDREGLAAFRDGLIQLLPHRSPCKPQLSMPGEKPRRWRGKSGLRLGLLGYDGRVRTARIRH